MPSEQLLEELAAKAQALASPECSLNTCAQNESNSLLDLQAQASYG